MLVAQWAMLDFVVSGRGAQGLDLVTLSHDL